ncbi:MAG: hypothetical protein NXI10_10835 [bacterium]|nr:hypothetical protein [bacterium]
MKHLLCIICILNLSILFGQDTTLLTSNFASAEKVKIIIRTERRVNDEFIAINNLTCKISNDSAAVYFLSYTDGMVSSLMIPFPIFEQFEDFERTISQLKCLNDCNQFILFEIDGEKKRYPIDILEEERLSGFMLKLEEQ